MTDARIAALQEAIAAIERECGPCGGSGHANGTEEYQCEYCGRPIAAILALKSAPPVERCAVPDGWQLVPKEPTQEMLDAAYTIWRISKGERPKSANTYIAMLASASRIPTPGSGRF